MSIYATNGERQVQFASNQGWGNLCRKTEANGMTGPVAEICNEGFYEPAAKLSEQLESIVFSDEDIDKTRLMLLEFVASLAPDEPVVITDGMIEDEGSGDANQETEQKSTPEVPKEAESQSGTKKMSIPVEVLSPSESFPGYMEVVNGDRIELRRMSLNDYDQHEFSCLMAGLTDSIESKVFELQSLIDDGDIVEKEVEPHVTVVYGIHTQDADAVLGLIDSPIEIKITGCSVFENEEHDVVKLDIESRQIEAAHNIVKRETEVTSSFSEYVPHITIAYVNSGTGRKYADKINLETEFDWLTGTLRRMIFSDQNKVKKTKVLQHND